MKFELDAVLIEEQCRTTALAQRLVSTLSPLVEVRYIVDGRVESRPVAGSRDPFRLGKRRMVVMKRRGGFLMGCPARSEQFACCGYLVMVLASNCPMDCSYCFLQEHVANNPGLQLYANYADAFQELDRLVDGAKGRNFRIGTGELADSLAFDSLTGVSRELVSYFATRNNLMLELKTKTDDIENLLTVDPRARTLVSWSLSPVRVFSACEHHTAHPSRRLMAARRLAQAGYRVGFHFDPVIAYAEAERDYLALADDLFDAMAPNSISFISIGGLRMTSGLRAIARRRFPDDPMLVGEEVLGEDRRYRSFVPLRLRLFTKLRERIARARPDLPVYLCMESASVWRRVIGTEPPPPSLLGTKLAAL